MRCACCVRYISNLRLEKHHTTGTCSTSSGVGAVPFSTSRAVRRSISPRRVRAIATSCTARRTTRPPASPCPLHAVSSSSLTSSTARRASSKAVLSVAAAAVSSWRVWHLARELPIETSALRHTDAPVLVSQKHASCLHRDLCQVERTRLCLYC